MKRENRKKKLFWELRDGREKNKRNVKREREKKKTSQGSTRERKRNIKREKKKKKKYGN